MSVTRRRGRDFCGHEQAVRRGPKPDSWEKVRRSVARGYAAFAKRYGWREDVHPWVAQQRAEIEEAKHE